MKLEVFDVSKAQLWDSYIDSSINGTLYHSWDWLKIVEKHSKYKLYPLVFYDKDDDKPFGLFPVFHKKLCGVSMVFSPPPGSAITLGPALLDKGYKQHRFELANLAFQKSIDDFIKKIHADYILISTSPGLMDMRPFQWAGYDVRPSYTYIIDLEQGKEMVFASLGKQIRKNVRKAEKDGIQVYEIRNVNSVDIIYDSVKSRYEEQGLKIKVKREYLIDLFNRFNEARQLIIYQAIVDGKVAGTTLCTNYKNTTTTMIGGARNSISNFEAMELIRWNVIKHAIEEGKKFVDMFGANTCRLCDAKSQFNPTIICAFQLSKSNIKGKLAERAYKILKNNWFRPGK